jgi:hypothetical protein
MDHAELVQKWGLGNEELPEDATSYLTTDIDYGTSKVEASAGALEEFVRTTWTAIVRRDDDFSHILKSIR